MHIHEKSSVLTKEKKYLSFLVAALKGGGVLSFLKMTNEVYLAAENFECTFL